MMMRNVVCVMAAIAMLTACSRKNYVETTEHNEEREYALSVSRRAELVAREVVDSVVVRDSVVVVIGDTVKIERWHTDSRVLVRGEKEIVEKTDTVYKERDVVRSEKVRVTKTVTKRSRKAVLWAALIGAAVGAAAVGFVKIKSSGIVKLANSVVSLVKNLLKQ